VVGDDGSWPPASQAVAEPTAWVSTRKARRAIQIAALVSLASWPCALAVAAAPGTGQPAHQRVWLFMSFRDTSLACPSTVRDEIVRIWRLNGVEVVYPHSSSEVSRTVQSPRSAVVFLLGSAEDLPAQFLSGVSRSAFGATLADGGVTLPVTYAFIDRALRFVRHAQRDASGHQELTLSLLLGRIVAHEIGHVLLRSVAHSSTGLMRSSFDYFDLMPGGDCAYKLTAEERTAVHAFLTVTAGEEPGRPSGVPAFK
jgi:hypothetical protein